MLDIEEQEIRKNWKTGADKPLVSIFCITFNHEKYIEEAIDSFLMQRTEFPFEIVLSDDCSTDKTADIVQIYMEKFPNIMNVNLRSKNVGAMINFTENIKQCTGKYIAFCEGDDFWTSPYKLQKQVDLIQSNETFKAVFSQVKWVDKDSKELGFSDNGDREKGMLDYKKLLQVNPVHTCAFLMDKDIYTDAVNRIITRAPYGDYVLFLAASFYGKIAFVDEVLAAYRRNVGIMHKWSGSESGVKRLEIFDLFEEHTEFKKMKFYIRIARQYLCIHVSRHFSDEKNYKESLKYFILALYYAGYVLFAKKDEMYRKVGVAEFIKTGVFSLPYVKVVYRKIKGIS